MLFYFTIVIESSDVENDSEIVGGASEKEVSPFDFDDKHRASDSEESFEEASDNDEYHPDVEVVSGASENNESLSGFEDIGGASESNGRLHIHVLFYVSCFR